VIKYRKEVQTLYPRDIAAGGRFYTTSLLSEQSEEINRAALSFAEGSEITFSRVMQLKIYGAALFLSSKLPEEELLFFRDENKERILN
jgi:DNA-directed RNA polymerase